MTDILNNVVQEPVVKSTDGLLSKLTPLEGYESLDPKVRLFTRLTLANNPELDLVDVYTSTYDRFKALDTSTIDGEIDGLAQQYTLSAGASMVEAAAANTLGAEPRQYTDVVKDWEVLKEEYTGPVGKQKILTDVALPDLDVIMRNQIALENAGYQLIEEKAEERNIAEKAWDWTTLIFSTDFSIDRRQEVEEGRDLLADIQHWQNQTPEYQAANIENKIAQLYDVFDNNHVKVGQAWWMYTRGDYADISALLEADSAINLATLIGPATKLAVASAIAGRRLTNKTQVLQNTVDVGRPDIAAQEQAARTLVKEGDETEALLEADAANGMNMAPAGSTGVDGVSASKQVANVRAEIKALVDEATRPIRENKEGFLTPEMQARAQENIKHRLDEYYSEHGKLVDNVEVIESTDIGFTVSYSIRDAETGSLVANIPERVIYYTRDNVQGVVLNTEKEAGWSKWAGNLFSPDWWQRTIDHTITPTLTRLGKQSALLRNNLIRIQESINKPLAKVERFNVNEVLLKGDQVGKVYSVEELVTGTATGKRLTSKEVTAYYQHRELLDRMHTIYNIEERNAMLRKGLKHVRMRSDFYFAKVEDDIAQLRSLITGEDFILAPQISKSGKNLVKGYNILGQLAKLEAEGFKLIRLEHPLYAGRQRPVSYGLMRSEKGFKVGELPYQVVHKNEGYVPRLYKPGLYFVKDVASPFFSTQKVFNNRAKAEAWAAQQQGKELQVFAWDQFTPLMREMELYDSMGGPITGVRKKTNLSFDGMDDVTIPPARMNADVSTAAFINRVSETMPLNDYKQRLIVQWEKMANDVAMRQGLTANSNWKPITFFDDTLPLRSDLGRFQGVNEMLRRQRSYLQEMFGFRTSNEISSNRWLTRFTEWLEGKGLEDSKIRDWTLALRSKDPVIAAKAAVYNLYLGVWNIRQLWVQANNAVVAMSHSPQHALPALQHSLAMLPAHYIADNPKAVALLAKSAGMKEKDFVALVKAFKDSGFLAAITRNADVRGVEQGVSGATMTTLRKLSNSGLMFWRGGEAAARSIAYNIAVRRLAAKNKGTSVADLLAVPNNRNIIIEDAQRLVMNMQRENSAAWQTNSITALPTQFFQVTAKFLESVMLPFMGKKGNQWTKAEASRVVAGQLFMYGAVGVPMIQQMSEWLTEEAGYTPERLEQEAPFLNEFIEEGLTGMLLATAGAEDLNMSTSVSLLASLGQGVLAHLVELVVNQKLPEDATQIIPAGGIFTRGGDVLTNFVRNVNSMWNAPTFDQFVQNVGDASFDIIAGEDGALTLASSFNNIIKTRLFYKYKAKYSRHFNRIIGERDVDDVEIEAWIGRALGFRLDVEESYGANINFNKQQKAFEEQAIDYYLDALAHYGKYGNKNMFDARLMVFEDMFDNEQYMAKVKLMARDKMLRAESSTERAAKQAFENYINSGGRGSLPLRSGE